MSGMVADPAFPLVLIALLLALIAAFTYGLVSLLRHRRIPTTTIVWGDEDLIQELPYRPEDVRVGIDVSPHTGRETVVVMVTEPDGRQRIVMAKERSVDDE